MLRRQLLFPVLIALAAAIAACGGGGGTGNVVPAPHVGPTQVPVGPMPQAVDLSGGGYSLSLTLPVPANGSTTTMSAVLQTTLPSGTTAPQSAKRRQGAPRPLDATLSGLAYLIVSTADPIGFSSAPSFQYTLPAGMKIASGSFTYILYWDPYVSGSSGWITLLGPGAVNGQTVTFPAVQTGMQLQPDTQYIYALAVSAQPKPTATPAPTPTPTANPSAPPSALPAYCANYSTPPPNSGIGSPQPVYFTDKSGTGAQVYFYVLEGADANGQTRYLGTDGTIHPFTDGATAPPMPLECFPGSTHNGNGKTFELPAPPTSGYGANLYIAYATPQPRDAEPPNPLPFTGVGTGYSGPSLDWKSPNYANVPFEFVEYQLPNATLDVTQVDKVGLPLQVTQNSSKYGNVTIGFASSAAYQNLLTSIEADPSYKNLAVATVLRNKSVLARILAPQDAYNWGFPQDWWFNSNFNPSYSSNGLGYIGYVLQQYKTSPRFYTLNGIAGYGSASNYCVTSDGSSSIDVYAVSGPPCPGTFSGAPNYTLNVPKALEGDTLVGNNVCQSILFAMPWGSASASNGVLPDQNAFYVWKAMVLDLNRGLALSTSTHPVDGWATAPSVLPPFSDFYPSPYPNNTYAKLVHSYMNGHKAYALPYDEPGGYAPTTTSDASAPLQLTVWNIPAYTRAVPTVVATPSPGCPP